MLRRHRRHQIDKRSLLSSGEFGLASSANLQRTSTWRRQEFGPPKPVSEPFPTVNSARDVFEQAVTQRGPRIRFLTAILARNVAHGKGRTVGGTGIWFTMRDGSSSSRRAPTWINPTQ